MTFTRMHAASGPRICARDLTPPRPPSRPLRTASNHAELFARRKSAREKPSGECEIVCQAVWLRMRALWRLPARRAACRLELQRLRVPRHPARSQPGGKHPSHRQAAKRFTCLGNFFAQSSVAFRYRSLEFCKSRRRRGKLSPPPCSALRMPSFAC